MGRLGPGRAQVPNGPGRIGATGTRPYGHMRPNLPTHHHITPAPCLSARLGLPAVNRQAALESDVNPNTTWKVDRVLANQSLLLTVSPPALVLCQPVLMGAGGEKVRALSTVEP